MRFARRLLVLLGSLILFAAAALFPAAAPISLAAQSAPNSAASPASPGNALAPPNTPQAYTLPPEKLAAAIALSRIRNLLDIAGSLWGIVFLWLLLAARGWSRLEAWAQRRTKRRSGSRWQQGTLFFFAFFILTWLAALPLDAIGHHYERSYQISVQGWASWLADESKALAIALVLGTLLLLLFHWIVRRWPRRYWFGAWLVTLPILVLGFFVEPLAEPLFFHYEPLAKNHPALVQELEKIVARTGTDIPPDRMFLMKASEKSNGLNAYVSGLGATKRIVVWDNTAGRIPDDEILFIFGHESGHYVLHHIPKIMAGYAIALFFVYWACSAFAAWLIRRRGLAWGAVQPEPGADRSARDAAAHPADRALRPADAALTSRTGFVVLIFAISIAGFLLEPAANAFSRHFEHQADVYGQEAIHGLVLDPQQTAVAAFNDLGRAWLDDPDPSPLVKFWLYNHPSTEDRANFALHYDPWANGGRGEFFDK
jgi:STE24 endopeptidase